MGDWKALKSSNLRQMRYDDIIKRLEIEFTNGSTYHYDNVPMDVALSLETAPSKGTYFAQNIKTKFNFGKA